MFQWIDMYFYIVFLAVIMCVIYLMNLNQDLHHYKCEKEYWEHEYRRLSHQHKDLEREYIEIKQERDRLQFEKEYRCKW